MTTTGTLMTSNPNLHFKQNVVQSERVSKHLPRINISNISGQKALFSQDLQSYKQFLSVWIYIVQRHLNTNFMTSLSEELATIWTLRYVKLTRPTKSKTNEPLPYIAHKIKSRERFTGPEFGILIYFQFTWFQIQKNKCDMEVQSC